MIEYKFLTLFQDSLALAIIYGGAFCGSYFISVLWNFKSELEFGRVSFWVSLNVSNLIGVLILYVLLWLGISFAIDIGVLCIVMLLCFLWAVFWGWLHGVITCARCYSIFGEVSLIRILCYPLVILDLLFMKERGKLTDDEKRFKLDKVQYDGGTLGFALLFATCIMLYFGAHSLRTTVSSQEFKEKLSMAQLRAVNLNGMLSKIAYEDNKDVSEISPKRPYIMNADRFYTEPGFYSHRTFDVNVMIENKVLKYEYSVKPDKADFTPDYLKNKLDELLRASDDAINPSIDKFILKNCSDPTMQVLFKAGASIYSHD